MTENLFCKRFLHATAVRPACQAPVCGFGWQVDDRQRALVGIFDAPGVLADTDQDGRVHATARPSLPRAAASGVALRHTLEFNATRG